MLEGSPSRTRSPKLVILLESSPSRTRSPKLEILLEGSPSRTRRVGILFKGSAFKVRRFDQEHCWQSIWNKALRPGTHCLAVHLD